MLIKCDDSRLRSLARICQARLLTGGYPCLVGYNTAVAAVAVPPISRKILIVDDDEAVASEIKALGAQVTCKPLWLDELVQLARTLVEVIH